MLFVGAQQRQPFAQRLLKADFAGHAPVGERADLGHHVGLVGLALQGNFGQLIEAFYLREGAVEIENKVGQGAWGQTYAQRWTRPYLTASFRL